MFTDQRLEKRILQFTRRRTWRKALAVFAARYLLLFLIGLVAFARVDQALQLLLVLLIVWGLTALLQLAVGRCRPFDAGLTPLIRPWIRTPSFPSAHASLAFAAGVAGCLVGPWFGAVALLLAVLIAFSRVAVGVHFFSDILAGAVLGGSVALLLFFMLN